MSEYGPHTLQWQLFCKLKSTGSFTSMSKISLELWDWTLGCWIFTATVLPSCSTALCTWASDAAPKGVSSKLIKSSFICQEKRKRHQLGVTEVILRKALPTGQSSHAKAGQTQPSHPSSVPSLSLVIVWPLSEACQTHKCPGDTLLMETCDRVPAACFILDLKWPSSMWETSSGCPENHLEWLRPASWVQKATAVPSHVFLLQIFNTTHHHPWNLPVCIPVHYSSNSQLTWWKPAHDWEQWLRAAFRAGGQKSLFQPWQLGLKTCLMWWALYITPSVKVTSALNSEKAPIGDSKALGEQERKLLEALAEKFRTRLQADEMDLPGTGPGSKIQGRYGWGQGRG